MYLALWKRTNICEEVIICCRANGESESFWHVTKYVRMWRRQQWQQHQQRWMMIPTRALSFSFVGCTVRKVWRNEFTFLPPCDIIIIIIDIRRRRRRHSFSMCCIWTIVRVRDCISKKYIHYTHSHQPLAVSKHAGTHACIQTNRKFWASILHALALPLKMKMQIFHLFDEETRSRSFSIWYSVNCKQININIVIIIITIIITTNILRPPPPFVDNVFEKALLAKRTYKRT